MVEVVDGWVGVPDALLLDGEPSPASVAPSGWLAVELDQYFSDPSALDDAALLDAVVGFDRVVSWAQARQARLLAELMARRGDHAEMVNTEISCGLSRYAPDEVGVALHLSRGTAMVRCHQAVQLVERLPETLALFEEGKLDQRKASAVCDATMHLSPEHTTAVEARVLPRAPEQTAAQLRASLKRAVIAADPDGAAERHHEARKDRRVAVNPDSDGMASLWALLPAAEAISSFEWLTRLARGLGADDPRTMDQRRADLLADLLTGRLRYAEHSPVNPGKPLVTVIVPMDALIGASEEPAELVGYGPIVAEAARELAASAVWRRLLTDPKSGALVDYGRTVYTPPVGLADFVKARDVYCRFPGCRRLAVNGEIDHIEAYPEGPTRQENLAGYCVHHHHLKHEADWQVSALPDGGLEWISPTGRRYVTRPHDYRGDPAPPPPSERHLTP